MTFAPQRRSIAVVIVLSIGAVASLGGLGLGLADHSPALRGIHKIQHVIVVMQENRSFDNYFGTYPGADGIPMRDGRPTVCISDPQRPHCVRPFHDPNLVDSGGPHTYQAARADMHGGQMNGFIKNAILGSHAYCADNAAAPECTGVGAASGRPDTVGWHDAREIPNYWTYAQQFVLQDRMFESVRSWSLPAHLDMVSGWSASCPSENVPISCHTDLARPADVTGQGYRAHPTDSAPYDWTDLTYLLHNAGVTWNYFVAQGGQPDCADSQMFCSHQAQAADTPDIWNPLPGFQTVHDDNQLSNIQPSANYFTQAAAGTLPSVSWIVPNERNSEHPPASIAAGQAWVTGIVNTAMQGPDWNSTAIFISWDDWGGFYDHVMPPTLNSQGYGLRVPGLVVSPYARTGYIDHQLLSTDSYLRFIEDDFLHRQRIDPQTDGRPDGRPFVAEDARGLGDLRNDFNFRQSPRPPLLLRPHPPPGPASTPGG